MEDDCWCDTILSADPNIPDGGRSNGLGSFYEYAMHCREQRHVRCRDRRLETQVRLLPRAWLTERKQSSLPRELLQLTLRRSPLYIIPSPRAALQWRIFRVTSQTDHARLNHPQARRAMVYQSTQRPLRRDLNPLLNPSWLLHRLNAALVTGVRCFLTTTMMMTISPSLGHPSRNRQSVLPWLS